MMHQSAKETVKDLIAQGSNIGLILKMMGLIDDAALLAGVRAKRDGQLLGDALVEQRAITVEERDRALKWQERMRRARSILEIEDLLAEVEKVERHRRAALFEAIPPTNPGEVT